jgi:response regulator RpfG family c-di-GMP phosphodiesterase
MNAPPDLADPAATDTTSDSPRPRVLLVDDEESILAALCRLLRREPYEILTARQADEALALLAAQPVQLVIADHRMPGRSGTALLREVQQRWPDTIRIVLSGYSEVKAIIAAINDGAIYKFITKPWNDEELKLHVRRALEQAALRAENARLTAAITQQNQQLRKLNRLLDQKAADASQGLTCAQTLLETVEVGIVAIDGEGLVVAANLRAAELLTGAPGAFLGLSARAVFPAALHAALPTGASGAAARQGAFTLAGARLQWRCRPLGEASQGEACVLAIWRDVPCTAP